MIVSEFIEKLISFKAKYGNGEIFMIYDKYNTVLFPAAEEAKTYDKYGESCFPYDPNVEDIDLGERRGISVKISQKSIDAPLSGKTKFTTEQIMEKFVTKPEDRG